MATKKKRTLKSEPEPKLKILVSSVVYQYEDLLDSIFALLNAYGYEVLMSHRGTVPVNPGITAMENCLEAVDACDLFLGIILPRYGSGKESKDGLSITHREMIKAIQDNKPRWFLVHENVAIARQVLQPLREKDEKGEFTRPMKLVSGLEYPGTRVLPDLRLIDMCEIAMRHDIHTVSDRTGNWVQTFGPDDDARLFATAQFRRNRELLEKHLPQLKHPQEIKRASKDGTK